jgi:hypothetical protein
VWTRQLTWLLVFWIACGFSNDLVDDSTITVAFEFPMSGADEKSGTIMVPVVLSRVAEVPVTVMYSVLSGNGATPSVDFDVIAGTLRFEPGELRKEVPVTIRDDLDETEGEELFDIALTSPFGADLDARKAIHRVRIANYTLPRVTLNTMTSSSEGTPSMLRVNLDKAAMGEAKVVIGVAPGMPAGVTPGDLTIVDNTMVTIPAGQTMVMVPIGEKDDALDEEDSELAVFSLRGPTPNIVLGGLKTQDHAVLDNDALPIVRFTQTTSSVNENVGIGLTTVQVSLNVASGRTVRVNFGRDGGNDSADSDDAVLVAPGTLTFSPGDTQKTITVLISNDNIDEDGESVILTLSVPLNGNATLGTATHTITINDNDTSSVDFDDAATTVSENDAGATNITVELSTPSSKLITVPFTVSPSVMGTPDAGDYTVMTPTPITFMPGITQRTITIDFPDNSPGNEDPEILYIDLNTPTNAMLGSPSRHTITITE